MPQVVIYIVKLKSIPQSCEYKCTFMYIKKDKWKKHTLGENVNLVSRPATTNILGLLF